MKIGIDARMYGPRCSGLGRYIQQLILNLEGQDKENSYIIFLNKENFDDYKPIENNFKKVLVDIPWYSWGEQIKFLKILNKENLDLMHFPHFNVPIFYYKKYIVTIHDLIMYHFPRPEASTRSKIIFYLKDKVHRFVLKNACKKSSKILTTSEFTKKDLIKYLKINSEKIKVTYQAPFCKKDKIASKKILKILNLEDKKYLLYVGNAYPHKNLENLIKAWNIFINNLDFENYYLVLVGKNSYFYEKLFSSSDFQKSKNIIFTGFVPDEDLQSLYENAENYIFPSLYEGFGLPPLEAMSYGIPVLSSNASCLPEILADSVLYFDPVSPENIADTMKFFLEDKILQMELQQKSRQHVKSFSSERLARETLEEYKKIMN